MIAAVVILYYPSAELLTNISSYYNYVDVLHVFDNSPTPLATDVFANLLKIQYHHDGENKGIAIRLNAACNLARENGFNWLLTMDQDTKFSPDTIEQYMRCFKAYNTKQHVGVFGTNYTMHPGQLVNPCQADEIDRVITSGMLVNLHAYTTIGGFDENIFIDLVDDDYCIASRLAGFAVVRFSNIYIEHRLGTLVKSASIKTLFLIKKTKVIHSPLRCYYMYRNLLYLSKKYKHHTDPLSKKLRSLVPKHIIKCLLYGGEARKTVQYVLKAKKDFRNQHMGKIKQASVK